ncbi:DUF4150 domain-containing protein [Paracoccus zhejiangensis]|uniref:Uncharacterized protein n=1 Tax=Paracoccus zhejiangensis TaxID=1077935 RepID=A0A2H5F4Q0_9RHOB|nr:DUF4150 domain-containing protein [Paracoccus zhejiangensis]AUH66520.1 hypothetical protein CX676_19610 [Paracoccus zhejiangensis]
MTVFANGLEISSKKQGCKVIAAFPDTCFTPPLTPATPPGVPVPYPDFGQDSDLTSGTGTVNIGGEPVSQENSSKYSKCSGDEAGSAPKKGIITSKNMGAVYAQKWSMDVKFEGKGVVRFSDMATSNHACNPGDCPPMVIVAKLNLANADCAALAVELQLHEHGKSPCQTKKTGKESEHTFGAATLQKKRGKTTCSKWPNYDDKKAPCICMQAYHMDESGKPKSGPGSKQNTDHNRKTNACEDLLDACRDGCTCAADGSGCSLSCTIPTAEQFLKTSVKATCENDERIRKKGKEEKGEATRCLTAVNLAYLAGVDEKDDEESAKKKMDETKKKPICGKGVCKSDKNAPCPGC